MAYIMHSAPAAMSPSTRVLSAMPKSDGNSPVARRLGQLNGALSHSRTIMQEDPHRLAVASVASSGGGVTTAPACLDYAYTFITGGGPDNAIRFWVESKTTLFDDKRGTAQTFYQCASCKSEDTFGRGLARSGRLLFQDPNYDFCPVYSTPPVPISSSDPADLTGGDLIIYRRRLDDIAGYRQVLAYEQAIKLAFGVPTLRPYQAKEVYEVGLEDFDSIAEATRNCVPMVQRTELRGSDGLRAVIECPIKTMNIAMASSTPSHHPARTWQVSASQRIFLQSAFDSFLVVNGTWLRCARICRRIQALSHFQTWRRAMNEPLTLSRWHSSPSTTFSWRLRTLSWSSRLRFSIRATNRSRLCTTPARSIYQRRANCSVFRRHNRHVAMRGNRPL